MYPIVITKGDPALNIESKRGGGPGGQNVNKRMTTAVLYFHVTQSLNLDNEQKRTLLCKGCTIDANESLKKLWNRLSGGGVLRFENQTERGIEQNVDSALRVLNQELNEALKPIKERVEKPTQRIINTIRKQKEKSRFLKYKKQKESLG
jgi:protein subunit release factor B